MSKSPKYNRVGNGERRRERLERERRAREQRRREEEAREATARLTAARKEAKTRVNAVETACTALAAEPDVRDGDVRPLLADLKRLRDAVDAAGTPAEVNTALKALVGIEGRRAGAEAALRQRRVDDARIQLELVRGLVAAIDPAQRSRFDASGAKEVDAEIEKLAARLDADKTAGFAERAERAQQRVLHHRGVVADGEARHAEAVRDAEDALARLRTRHAGLIADAQSARVRLEQLGLVADVISKVAAELAADRPTEAQEIARKLAVRMDKVERDLDETIDRLTARREMLTSVVEALPDLGFTVDAGSLVEDTDGSIAIQAHRLSGEPVAVVVQDGDDEVHRINFLRETDADADDGALNASACTNLADLAGKLNDHIRGDGFQPGNLTWDDQAKPPAAGRAVAGQSQPQQRGAQA